MVVEHQKEEEYNFILIGDTLMSINNTFAAKNWIDMIRPTALEVDKDALKPNYGKFVAKPLERGYGLTLGNSLRRVLLSSLQGAGIVA
jgi:DNA-directed RNA polymerase subunit alpha